MPRFVRFSGSLSNPKGASAAGSASVRFALFSEQSGGTAQWSETQRVEVSDLGRYSVLLGANSAQGIPQELFTSSEARWLSITVEGETEQPRVLLVSVPYALKAGDAETLGGLPASAYALAGSGGGNNAVTGNRLAGIAPKMSGTAPKLSATATTTTGQTNFIAKFTDTNGTLGNASIFEVNGFTGFGTTTPAGRLSVETNNPSLGIVVGENSGATPKQLLIGIDTVGNYSSLISLQQGIGYNPLSLQTFGGSVGVGTTTPGGKFAVENNSPFGIVVGQNSGANPRQLLFGYDTEGNYGAISAVEQGLAYRALVFQQNGGNVGIGVTTPAAKLDVTGGDIKLSSNGSGLIFADNSKQTSAALGTITGVTASTGLTGGGTSGTVNLAVNPSAVQTRVTGSCAVGQYVRAIASDGSVTCGVDAGGTITGVTAGTGILGGGTSGNVGVAVDATVARANASNNFAASQTVTGNLTVSGTGNGVLFPDGTKQTTAATGGGPTVLGGTLTIAAQTQFSAGTCTTLGVTVTGAQTTMAVAVSPKGDPLAKGLSPEAFWVGYVDATNHVNMKICKIGMGFAVTNAALDFNIRVIP